MLLARTSSTKDVSCSSYATSDPTRPPISAETGHRRHPPVAGLLHPEGIERGVSLVLGMAAAAALT